MNNFSLKQGLFFKSSFLRIISEISVVTENIKGIWIKYLKWVSVQPVIALRATQTFKKLIQIIGITEDIINAIKCTHAFSQKWNFKTDGWESQGQQAEVGEASPGRPGHCRAPSEKSAARPSPWGCRFAASEQCAFLFWLQSPPRAWLHLEFYRVS